MTREISFHHPEIESDTGEAELVLILVNQFRQQNGLGPLKIDARLQASAQSYAELLTVRKEFEHTIDGTTPGSRAIAKGFPNSVVGENIARGFSDPNSVMIAWENSPGHRANLLYTTYSLIGIGVADGPMGKSWVQDFSPAIPAGVPVPMPTPVPIIPATPISETFSLIGKYDFYLGSLGNYVLTPTKPIVAQ